MESGQLDFFRFAKGLGVGTEEGPGIFSGFVCGLFFLVVSFFKGLVESGFIWTLFEGSFSAIMDFLDVVFDGVFLLE